MKKAMAGLRPFVIDPFNRLFLVGLGAVVALGAWLRSQGLSTGTLFRDDAWVALTSKMPFGTAWHMVGTAPGFVMIERWWVQLSASHLWLMQMPTFVVSVAGLALLGAVAQWWGLPRTGALLVVAIIAFSKTDVIYATHLKPYAHDIVATTLLLATARWFQRGGTAAWFAGVASLCLVTSFSVLPLVLGLSMWMFLDAKRSSRLKSLAIPGVLAMIPVTIVAWGIRGGISPRLDISWQSSYVDFSSLQSALHSANSIATSLLSGLFDTTPGLGIPFLGRAIQFAAIGLLLLSLRRLKDSGILWSGLLGAFLACLAHVAPLGTGRTDAYLHPALAMLAVIGGVELVHLVRQRVSFAVSLVMVVAVFTISLTGLDRLAHPVKYAGGNFRSVITEAHSTVANGGAVLIEGTARWPWAFYGARTLTIRFSPLYNTGFAPVSGDQGIVLMPGTSIEGNYSPSRAVSALKNAATVLYVQSDDWSAMGHPLDAPLRSAGYVPETPMRHQDGYFTQVWHRGS